MRTGLFLQCAAALVGLTNALPAPDNDAQAARPSRERVYKHVFMLSVDGMHGSDVEKWVSASPNGSIAALLNNGYEYSQAWTSAPSDSFPGTIAQYAGSSPRTTGLWYDDVWDRSIYAPGSDCSGAPGAQAIFDESVDYNSSELFSGGINPANLPRRKQNGKCEPIYPHQRLRVNTIFEVARAKGMETAYTDKHPAYDLVRGPSGTGLSTAYFPEMAAVAGGVPATIEYDKLHVNAWLAWLDGNVPANSEGSLKGVPALFGGNLQALSVAQKTAGYNNDSTSSLSPEILQAFEFVDGAIGSVVNKLRAKGFYNDTLIILASKHGQAPIQRSLYGKVDPAVITQLVGVPVASQTSDDIALIFLNHSSQTQTAANNLNAQRSKGKILSVIYGKNLTDSGFGNPATDPAVPDIIVQPELGIIYTTSKSKVAEHGGLSEDDRHVACILSSPSLRKRTFSKKVLTTQIGPTVLQLLGLDAGLLQGTREEGTKVLPGFRRGRNGLGDDHAGDPHAFPEPITLNPQLQTLDISYDEGQMWYYWLAWAGLIWYCFILLVITIGISQLYRNFSQPTATSVAAHLPEAQVPHVTVIRPIVGTDPYLYECLASTFRQDYPKSKLSVHFCIPTRDEPALPVLQRLLQDYSDYDASIYIAEEDPVLLRGRQGNGDPLAEDNEVLGPNPKIRNMSRGYREAKGDIIWIIDCNVWAGPSVCGLMIDRICGLGTARGGRKFKFAHQVPLAVDVTDLPESALSSASDIPSSSEVSDSPMAALLATGTAEMSTSILPTGNRLEEMFLSTSHCKFYTAISTVAIAPCTVGKSNMFRRSHLDALTPPSHPQRSAGIDFFSDNICEDHLISDLLWRSAVPEEVKTASQSEGQAAGSTSASGKAWGNHALLIQPPCVQPLAGVSFRAYAARRSRWLRVRKYTVPAATLVEPGTESFVANALACFALTTLPYFHDAWGIPHTWTSFWLLWLVLEALWCMKDWHLWGMLQGWKGEGDDVAFIGHGLQRRCNEGLWPWLKAWVGRESLAFLIWAWAIFGGATVVWRGRSFWVDMQMKVHEIVPSHKQRRA